jgi:hypothetical protein
MPIQNLKIFKHLLFFAFYIYAVFCKSVCAQQTIFNVPSADITEKGRFYLQHEAQFKLIKPNQFYTTTNYATYGIIKNIELNATQFNIGSPASRNASLGFGFKANLASEIVTKNLHLEKYQPKLILGSMIPISLQNQGIGRWIYLEGNIFIPQSKTRITSGLTSGSKQIFGKKTAGFLGGIEQKISTNFSLIADWYSGNHAMGLLAAGFSYQFPREVILFAGLQRANSKKTAANGLIVEIGKTF